MLESREHSSSCIILVINPWSLESNLFYQRQWPGNDLGPRRKKDKRKTKDFDRGQTRKFAKNKKTTSKERLSLLLFKVCYFTSILLIY